jgi:hypothetical protein
VRTIKLCANCDVALAIARCSYLTSFKWVIFTQLQMGNLHPGYAEDMSPKKVKFIFSSWTINGAAIPILGCIVCPSGSQQVRHSTTQRKAPPKRG